MTDNPYTPPVESSEQGPKTASTLQQAALGTASLALGMASLFSTLLAIQILYEHSGLLLANGPARLMDIVLTGIAWFLCAGMFAYAAVQFRHSKPRRATVVSAFAMVTLFNAPDVTLWICYG